MRSYLIGFTIFLMMSISMLIFMEAIDRQTNHNTIDSFLNSDTYPVDGMNNADLCTLLGCNSVMSSDGTYILDRHTGLLVRIADYDERSGVNFVMAAFLLTEYAITDTGVVFSVWRVPSVLDSLDVTVFALVLLWVIYSVMFIYVHRLVIANRDLLLATDKFKLQSKIQNTIAESAHHEMITPVTTVKACMDELVDRVPCNIRQSELVDTIYDSVHRLESVLMQMSNIKHEKFDSERRSILSLIRSSNKSQQVYHTNSNFYYVLDNADVADAYTSSNLNNGTLLNIFNNLIKNSLEAGATKIYFEAKIKSGKLQVTMSDNGRGLPESLKDLDKIFELGYTSKDIYIPKLDTPDVNIWSKLVRRVVGTPAVPPNPYAGSYRGIGLYLTKELLTRAGGNITVLGSSSLGTIFGITLKVTKV